MSQPIDTLLTALLRTQVPDFDTLVGAEQLTAGASQETWKIRYRSSHGETLLALRRNPTSSSSGIAADTITLATEAKLFALARRGGIPGPKILYVLQPEDGLGEGYLMQWLEGETLGHKILRSEALAETRKNLAAECGHILGRLHALDWQAAGLANALTIYSTEQLIETTWQQYLELNLPAPMIDYTWRWLTDHMPVAARQTLVHGDFRNGNLMVCPQGINAVLDWELAHVGDPVRDLGWLCVNSWRFGRHDKAVGGFGDRQQLLDAYEAETGIRIADSHLQFWEVFGSFWWAVCTLSMANSWRNGETASLERPVIGRRSSEAQMDCVNLLIPGEFEIPRPKKPAEGTQLPMPAELLDGVIDFLKQDVARQLDPRQGFLAKVAANSLSIAQRELLLGPELAAKEQARLTSLLSKNGDIDELRRELSAQLRAGLTLDTPQLAEHLRHTVAGQLAIDQPGYSALKVVHD